MQIQRITFSLILFQKLPELRGFRLFVPETHAVGLSVCRKAGRRKKSLKYYIPHYKLLRARGLRLKESWKKYC